MANLNCFNQDDSNVMGDGGFPLQEGEHPFIIASEEVKNTKANDGSYLQFNCVCDAGPQQGTEFAIRLNLWNSNPKAVEIAEKELNTLRISCGLGPVQDSSMFLNQRSVAVVKATKSGKNKGELGIKKYISVGEYMANAGQQQQQQYNAPQQAQYQQQQQQHQPQQHQQAQYQPQQGEQGNGGRPTPPWANK